MGSVNVQCQEYRGASPTVRIETIGSRFSCNSLFRWNSLNLGVWNCLLASSRHALTCRNMSCCEPEPFASCIAASNERPAQIRFRPQNCRHSLLLNGRLGGSPSCSQLPEG